MEQEEKPEEQQPRKGLSKSHKILMIWTCISSFIGGLLVGHAIHVAKNLGFI